LRHGVVLLPPLSPITGGPSAIDDDRNIGLLQITPSSVQVQFPGITGGNLMYVEERSYRGNQGRETPWENALILEGNKIFTLTGLRAGTEYRLRWQAPNRQFPDVMVETRGGCLDLTQMNGATL